MSVHRGSCLCDRMQERIDGGTPQIAMCRRSRFCKVAGSAFASIASVPAERFGRRAGRGLLSGYDPSSGVFRLLGRTCASPLHSRRPAPPKLAGMRLGTLSHLFTNSKASWVDLHGNAPQDDTRP